MSKSPRLGCAVCGVPVQPAFRAPQPEIAPDLDMRPGEPARSTLAQWVQVCRSCGLAAPDLAGAPVVAAGTVRDPSYVAAGQGAPAAVAPFLRWAAVCGAAGDRLAEAEALLQAAWAADDVPDEATARALRSRVAALWDGIDAPETALRRLDVLRRAGDMPAAQALSVRLAQLPLDETSRSVLRFQQARIAAGDTGRHLISSALPPPAVAPHVTHGRQRRPGLLSRVFGRG